MPAYLRLAAFVSFGIAIAIRVLDDTPDVLDIFTAIALGLALWVASEMVPDR